MPQIYQKGEVGVQFKIKFKNISKTKISAFKVSKKLDAGPICMEKIRIKGNAIRIYEDMEGICLEMIKKLIKRKI